MKNVKRHFDAPANYSYFLFGPRGTGKSTWVKQKYPKAHYINLLLSNVRRKYAGEPELLVKVVEGLKDHSRVIIDEIQRVPELLSIVHALIEEKRGIQFILTGSSARKLKQEGVNLLAGRAVRKEMHPFMASELKNKFVLQKAIQCGMLPLTWEQEDIEDILESYVNLYLLEEVQFEGLIRNIGNFSRFLSVIAFSHGSVLNIANISRECEVKRSTVENFLFILQDLLIAWQVPVFQKRAKRMLTTHPKFYLFDSGIFQTMRKLGPMDKVSEINGAALEGLILQHLKAWSGYSKGKTEIYYWRTKAGVEVDFVIYGENSFFAIEVKNTKKLSPKDLRGLINFVQDYPECTPILLYCGEDKLIDKGVHCIPCEEFLKNLKPNKPIMSIR